MTWPFKNTLAMAGGSDGETHEDARETAQAHGGMLHVCGSTGRGIRFVWLAVNEQHPCGTSRISCPAPACNLPGSRRGRGEGNRDVETGPVRRGAKAVETGPTTHAWDPQMMTGTAVVSCLTIRDKGFIAFASPAHAVFPPFLNFAIRRS
jgi:hypothetical protein